MVRWPFSFILFGALSLCAGPQQEEIKESLALRKIADCWKENDLMATQGRICQFLTEYPYSPYSDHLRAMLGDIYLQEKEYHRALEIYGEIQDQAWQEKVLLSSIHCLYELEQYERLLLTTRTFLNHDKGSLSEKNLVRFLHAESHYYLGKKELLGEKKEAWFTEALSHYKVLKTTPYAEKAWKALAYLHGELAQYPEASQAHLHLAESIPLEKEEHLFQAALYQTRYDKKEAIHTLKQVYPLKGSRAQLAAFYTLELLFEEERYQDLIALYAETSKLLENFSPSISYYVGRSLVAVGDYKHAAPLLLSYIKQIDREHGSFKNALLALSVAAEKIQDATLFTKALTELRAFFAKDQSVADTLLRHAAFCHKTGALDAADKDFRTLISDFPHHPERESILYDYGLLLAQKKQWDEACGIFDTFLAEFPASSKTTDVRRHQITCLFEDLKITASATETLKRTRLVTAIQKAIEDGAVFSKAERKQMHYLLGKTLYDLKHFDEALLSLSDFVALYPKDAHAKQAHLLIAYCHLQGSTDHMLFVIEAEKALSQKAVVADLPALHIQLYNSYLFLAEKAPSSEQEKLLDEAASHLFVALHAPIQRDNLLWLAQRYEHKAISDPEYLHRAILVLETLLQVKTSSPFSSTMVSPTEMEVEALKLSQLYEMAHKLEEASHILSMLSQEQAKHPEKPWKYQRRILFELAKIEAQCGHIDTALQTYDFLIQSASHTPSYFGPAAQLHKTLLLYQQLPIKEGDALSAILNTLKDLEIERKLSSEPSHLEAGLHYIHIKTQLSPESERLTTRLQLLRAMKENFTASDDPLVIEYFKAQERYAEEKRLFDDYIAYLSFEIHRIESVIKESEILGKTAAIELEALLGHPLHPSLQEWVDLSKEALTIPR